MAFALDEIFAYGGQLIVAAKKRVPKALGIGEKKLITLHILKEIHR